MKYIILHAYAFSKCILCKRQNKNMNLLEPDQVISQLLDSVKLFAGNKISESVSSEKGDNTFCIIREVRLKVFLYTSKEEELGQTIEERIVLESWSLCSKLIEGFFLGE